MPDNSDETYISYAPFIPIGVPKEERKKFYNNSEAKYVAEIDKESGNYVITKIRTTSDPEYYSRDAYKLYKRAEADFGSIITAKYLLRDTGLTNPSFIIEI